MTNHAPGQLTGRPLDDLLAAYASGRLSPALHVLVAGHLALAPESRTFVRSLEAAHGAALAETPPVPLAGRANRLAAIFAIGEEAAPDADGQEPATGDILPTAIARFVGTDFDRIAWRTLLPGVKEHRIEASGRGEAVLYWVRPGHTLPAHTHEGSEYALVLKGDFRDRSELYRAGDIAVADQEVDHAPRVEGDEDCICYVVTDAPVRPTRAAQRGSGPSRA